MGPEFDSSVGEGKVEVLHVDGSFKDISSGCRIVASRRAGWREELEDWKGCPYGQARGGGLGWVRLKYGTVGKGWEFRAQGTLI